VCALTIKIQNKDIIDSNARVCRLLRPRDQDVFSSSSLVSSPVAQIEFEIYAFGHKLIINYETNIE
jgi:hypothetical protein